MLGLYNFFIFHYITTHYDLFLHKPPSHHNWGILQYVGGMVKGEEGVIIIAELNKHYFSHWSQRKHKSQ